MFEYTATIVNMYASHLHTAWDNASSYIEDEEAARVEEVYNCLDMLFAQYSANENRNDRAMSRFVIDMAREYLHRGVLMASEYLESAGYAFADEEDYEVIDLEEWQERQCEEWEREHGGAEDDDEDVIPDADSLDFED